MAERVVRVKLAAEVAEFQRNMKESAESVRSVGTAAEKMAQQKQAFEQMGRGLVVAGAAITAVTALSIKAAIDWESAWTGVTKTVDGSAEQMAELEGGLRDLAQTLPAAHQEIAAVAEAAGQLGVAREDVVDFTKTMIDLSETTNLSADEAATSIAQLMNVMQTAPDEVDNLGAALVALGNAGASTERDIIQMAQRIAGAGKTVGLSEAQVLGFANALASVGIEAEAGGSAISRIMTDIAMSVSAGGAELDKFATVAGMSSKDFQKAFKEDPADAITTFIEGLGRIDKSGGDVFKTLSDLGQTDIRVSQALLGMANSGDLLRKSLDLGSKAWDENTALAVEAAKRYETTEARIEIAGNAVRDAAIDFGQVFLPAVQGAADGVAEFAKFIGGLPDPVQGVLGVLGSSVGMFALLGGTALLAVPKIAEFKNAMDVMGVSMRTVGIVGGGALVALTALVTVVGMVSAAQAEAQQKAKAYADTLAEGTHKVTDATRDMVKENLTAKDIWSWLTNSFSGSAYDAAETLGLGLDTVTDAAMGNAEALKEVQKATNDFDAGGKASADRWRELGISSADYMKAVNSVEAAVKGEYTSIQEAMHAAEQKQKADQDSAEGSQTAADAYMEAASGADELTDSLNDLIEKINEANGVGQDAVSANLNYQDALAKVDEQISKAREGVEGYSLGLDETTQAGRDNLAMLNDLAGKSQEAADKQFALDGNTDSYRATLEAGRQALIDRAMDLGYNADQAQALADKIYAIPSATEWELIADTSQATWTIQDFMSRYGRLSGQIIYRSNLDDLNGEVSGSGRMGTFARGGLVAYANGGIEDYAFAGGNGIDSGIFQGGTPIYKFAEPETGWEAFISGKPSEKQRNIGIWQETGRRLGVDAGGSTAVNIKGATITGRLDLGNGLVGVIDGRIQSAQYEEDRKWSSGGKSL